MELSLFEEIIISHPLKKFPVSYVTQGSLPCSQEPPLGPTLSQTNAVHTLTHSFFNFHFNAIVPSTTWSLTFKYFNKECVYIYHLMRATCPVLIS
jgi:hypothetical protein